MNIKVETYQQQKRRHSKEIDAFEGLFFAFSNAQLKEGLEKVGLPADCNPKDHIYSIGAGGYVLKTRIDVFHAMFERHEAERKELRRNRKELYDALVYELLNHEYCITYTTRDALDALGITKEDVEPEMLKKACKEALEKSIVK